MRLTVTNQGAGRNEGLLHTDGSFARWKEILVKTVKCGKKTYQKAFTFIPMLLHTQKSPDVTRDMS